MNDLLCEDPVKYCEICDNYKPERSHHCSKCKRCIRKMDHHCKWLCVCINNDNLGNFIRLLFFAIVDLSLIIVFYIYLLFTLDLKSQNVWQIRIIATSFIITILIALGVLVILSLFFVERFSFVLKNLTFIENCALEDYEGNNGQTAKDSPYNLGWRKNLEIQMGHPYLLYLYGEKGDGIFFEKRFECSGWPPVRRRTRIARSTPL